MRKIILIIILTFIFNNGYSQNLTTNKKIGLIFNLIGPNKITRDALVNIVGNSNNTDTTNTYYEAIKFIGTAKANPTERIINHYLKHLKSKNFEPIIIQEKIEGENFPNTNLPRKYFNKDLKYLKKQYNLDYLIIINGQFGMEFESVGFINGDKRTNISMINYFIDVNTNEIKERFNIWNIKNIKKRNLLNPPDFPNIVESMNRLLDERILPEIERKLDSYVIE